MLPNELPFTCTPSTEALETFPELEPAAMWVYFDYDQTTNSCQAVDYRTVFRAWVPKDFKRCVKINDINS